jgi:hypothetical protein
MDSCFLLSFPLRCFSGICGSGRDEEPAEKSPPDSDPFSEGEFAKKSR